MDGSDGKGRPLILLVSPEQEEHRYADSVCFMTSEHLKEIIEKLNK